jgi:hypothetical protein
MAAHRPRWSHSSSHAAWRRLIKAHALAGDQRSNQRAWVTGEEGEAKAGSDQAADRGGISAGMATTSSESHALPELS